MSTKETVLPPNSTFLTTVNATSSGISSKMQPTTQPLPPDNVTAISNNGVVTVTTTIYIDSADTLNSLNIYTGNSITDGLLDVYIVYDYEEEIPESLNIYTISFDIQDPNGEIQTIESYLWDEDPVSSRGTTTIVERN